MRFDYLTNDTERSLAPFFSPRMLDSTFACIWILGLLLIILWPLKAPSHFIEEYRVPLLFPGIFVAALLIHSYVNLRCGLGEMSRDDFISRFERKKVITLEEEHEFFSYGLVQSLLHTLLLLLLMLPLLIVSTAISGISLPVFAKAFSILFTTSLLCRLFGFLMYLLYGRWSKLGYLWTRMFFIFSIFFTGFFIGSVNPILLIYSFHRGVEIPSGFPMSGYSLYIMIVACAILLLTLANQAMVRRNMHKEIST
jgi:uncharacterized membrane protein